MPPDFAERKEWTITSRREFLLNLTGSATAAILPACAPVARPAPIGVPPETLGLSLSEAEIVRGIAFLRRYPSVDVHCHPGRFFLRDVPDPTPSMIAFGAPFEERAAEDLRAGGVSAALFSGVADVRLLEVSRTGVRSTREFAPGEAWADYQRQVRALRSLVARGTLVPGDDPADIGRAHRSGQTACVFSIEGGNFIEDRLERIEQAHRDGVRAITIVHYHINQIGDIQTEPPRHNGLTPLGAQTIREMNRVGIIVDLAHAPASVTAAAVEVSTRPMMISHTNLTTQQFEHPRLVSPEQARLVTTHGGLVGSNPWGLGQRTFGDWIDTILRLVDVVGIDHVAIGTDMDANFAPVFTDYQCWHLIPAALLARGMDEGEVAKILGGNFIRIFEANRPEPGA